MKTDSTGKIVEMKLDEIIDIYNSWTAVSDSLIVPAAIPNYLQTKQNYESILASRGHLLSGSWARSRIISGYLSEP